MWFVLENIYGDIVEVNFEPILLTPGVYSIKVDFDSLLNLYFKFLLHFYVSLSFVHMYTLNHNDFTFSVDFTIIC